MTLEMICAMVLIVFVCACSTYVFGRYVGEYKCLRKYSYIVALYLHEHPEFIVDEDGLLRRLRDE